MSEIILPAAAYQQGSAPHLSQRYVHVDTMTVVDAMLAEGFEIASAKSPKTRGKSPAYSRHLIDFRLPGVPAVDGVVPRVLFSNSHDGSSKAFAAAGLFRFVCENGLVVGNTYSVEKQRHIGDSAEQLIKRMQDLARNTAPLFGQIEKWQKKELTEAQSHEFAKFAAMLRWNDPNRFTPEEILQIKREADDSRDLWAVFNRVQENTTKGGLHGTSQTGRRTSSRPLNAIAANTNYNINLWNLASEFAE